VDIAVQIAVAVAQVLDLAQRISQRCPRLGFQQVVVGARHLRRCHGPVAARARRLHQPACLPQSADGFADRRAVDGPAINAVPRRHGEQLVQVAVRTRHERERGGAQHDALQAGRQRQRWRLLCRRRHCSGCQR
jgi:hypothetical protein